MSVSEATPMEQAWQALAVEAGPAKSLARLETASARVVTTIATVAALLTGLGLVAAGQPATAGWPRVLAVGSVVLAFAAVLFALAGQVLTVNPDLNLNNLADVEAWYRDLFTRRAPRTRTATILIVAATAAAGAAAILTLATTGRHDTLTLAVTRTAELPDPTATAATAGTPAAGSPSEATGPAASPSTSTPTGSLTASRTTAVTVLVAATARGLTPGQNAMLSVTAAGVPVADAVAVAGSDGVAATTLTIAHIPGQASVGVTAHAADTTGTSASPPGTPPTTTCTHP